MNRKGFTLIELLAVIVLIAIIGIITVPNLLNTVDSSKEASYDILIKNIVTASKTYYEECEYGDLSNSTKYGDYACIITNNTITTTLGALANTGFLKVNDSKNDESGKEVKVILDPRNKKKDMSSCQITITKNVDASFKVTYTITSNGGTNCPTTKEYEGAVQ